MHTTGKELIILKGQLQEDIKMITYNGDKKLYTVTFKNDKSYSYGLDNCIYIKDGKSINLEYVKLYNKLGVEIKNIVDIIFYEGYQEKYYKVYYKGSRCEVFHEKDLVIEVSTLHNRKAKATIEYFKKIVGTIEATKEDKEKVLSRQYERLSFVSKKSVLSMYLMGQKVASKGRSGTTIFPFGSNASQIKAVNEALSSQVSIIEGPPGTGKTQTILNIIANIIIEGKTVAVVSNNNEATNNVYEKLEKYGLEYIAAPLGNFQNRTKFIESQTEVMGDLSANLLAKDMKNQLMNQIKDLESKLLKQYETKNKIAQLKKELTDYSTQSHYFSAYFKEFNKTLSIFKSKSKIRSSSIMDIWVWYQNRVEGNIKISAWNKIYYMIVGKVRNLKVWDNSPVELISNLKSLFFEKKIHEIQDEIKNLENSLKNEYFIEDVNKLNDKSLQVLKYYLAEKYKNGRDILPKDALKKNPAHVLQQYPLVLSSTHSLQNSLADTVYDYVIVDEASQVDLVTGVLTMAVAKNIIVVGDQKQLPNIIPSGYLKALTEISEKENIPHSYRYESQSLLSSMSCVFSEAPKTLLREHYRCHPKIINFCNEKFYNNTLVVMTEDKGEEDVLQAWKTVKGNHARGRYNQRQVDVIKEEILPELQGKDVGIISPYRKQVNAMESDIDGIKVSTVHKFQGKEMDTIIITTVDNTITEFTDNPNMLNVAVSRAKKNIKIVVSDSEQNENTNIGDFLNYIDYHNFEVLNSEIFSVFDLLYKGYEQKRKDYLKKSKKISKYDSENIMYKLITEVLREGFDDLDVLSHQSLSWIIKEPHKLDEEERRYVYNDLTHVDFVIYNKLHKNIVLILEVDGYAYHKDGSIQKDRDEMKDIILNKYEIPFYRFGTTGSNERNKLQELLGEIYRKNS